MFWPRTRDGKSVNLEECAGSICPLPWLHMSVSLNTALRVCCNTDHGGFVLDKNDRPLLLGDLGAVEDYYNLPFMKSLRREMMNGRRPEFCRKCYKIEDGGGNSVRQGYLSRLRAELQDDLGRTAADGALETVKIRYIDFSLGNHCNLKCRMCNPLPSHSLRRDFEEEGLHFSAPDADLARTGWEVTPAFESLITTAVPALTEMLTTGGEPFLSSTHRFILKKIIESGDAARVVLRYHTNLTTLPEELVALWKPFKAIEVHVSLEGHGKINDYIRYPSQWDRIEANFDKLIGLKSSLPLWIEVHTCFQAYNLLSLADFLEFLQRYRGSIPTLPHPILLDNPPNLQAAALPPELRQEGVRRLAAFFERHEKSLLQEPFSDFHSHAIENFKCCMKMMTDLPFEKARFDDFLEYTRIFDRRRNQSLAALQPEFEPYLR